MNPFTTFRTLRDIARRRPILVGAIGLGLLAEAARVGEVLLFGGTVTVLGHTGAEQWTTEDGDPWIAAYVFWVGLCGAIVLGLAVTGRRRSAVESAATATTKAESAASAGTTTPAHGEPGKASGLPVRPAGSAVVWRRGGVEVRPNRHR